MFHVLGSLLIIVTAVIVIELALVGSVLRAIFGLGKRSSVPSSRGQDSTHSNSGQRCYRPTQANNKGEVITETRASKHRKLLDDNEGEYVDYEEIRDW